MSNWDSIRKDICEVSIHLNNAIHKLSGTHELSQKQSERLKKQAKRYGLSKIAQEICTSDDKEKCAEKIASTLIRRTSLFNRILRKVLWLILICAIIGALSYFYSFSSAMVAMGYLALGLLGLALFERDSRSIALLLIIAFGVCIYFFNFDRVMEISGLLVGVLCILAICFNED